MKLQYILTFLNCAGLPLKIYSALHLYYLKCSGHVESLSMDVTENMTLHRMKTIRTGRSLAFHVKNLGWSFGQNGPKMKWEPQKKIGKFWSLIFRIYGFFAVIGQFGPFIGHCSFIHHLTTLNFIELRTDIMTLAETASYLPHFGAILGTILGKS